MNTATAALTAILDTDHLKKALQTLDNAYAVGLPRGNRDLEAEIMLFAMANEPIDVRAGDCLFLPSERRGSLRPVVKRHGRDPGSAE